MEEVVENILKWYQENKRMLPWRIDQDPYHVWISEIMLQQTRIEAVIGYYERFLKRIPTIHDLAEIEEDELLKLWQGLGYYNRARNLKKSAMIIESKYHGNFPNTYQEILNLPGIGEYTASAIASISFQEKTPTIDGNVMRIYTRVYNDKSNIDLIKTKKNIRNCILKIMPEEAGNFNEALMEIGEVICIPNGTPKCKICPLKTICLAKKNQNWEMFPVKDLKKPKKEFKYTVMIIKYQEEYAIKKRNNQGILSKLWEFPNVEGHLSLDEIRDYFHKMDVSLLKIEPLLSYKHIFTHQIWDMKAFLIIPLQKPSSYVWQTLGNIEENYAIPSAFLPFLDAIKKNNHNF